ncbi:MAG: response regulator, partial [Phycisphaerae bacterium]|nr:response regulator [Phycisphaerae bacterium]
MSVERPIRVLVVDDDEAHAEALSDALEMDGARCVLAHSGADGIARLSEQTFDAVLTDLVMPDRSGMEVLREATRLQPDCAVLL